MLRWTSKLRKKNTKGLYAHKCYISKGFMEAVSEYKKLLQCGRYEDEEFLDNNMEKRLSHPFFTKRMKNLSRPDGFMLCGKLGVEFSSLSNCHV